MTDPRTALVGAGYDAMADTWEAWSARVADDARAEWLAKLVERLPPSADVLELGCGNGSRETRELARRYRLTAVDLSAEQLRRARARVPAATFVQADLTSLERPPGTLDAVCAFYVLNHVPRELLPGLVDRIRTWLRPDGLLLAVFGVGDQDDWFGEWLGVPMYFSAFDADRNRALLASFELLDDEVVEIVEPEGAVSFYWVLARR